MREKVTDAARELGLDVVVTTLAAPTRTVADAAAALDCDPARIAKSIVFVADGDPVVCVVSGAHRVDTELLGEVLDVAVVRQASPEEVRASTGFAVGGVPPFAHGLPVLMDETLLGHASVFPAGGDANTLFEVEPQALAQAIGARVVRLA